MKAIKQQVPFVSSVSGSLAAMALKRAYDRGEVIEIPSLNIKIQKVEIAPAAGAVGKGVTGGPGD